MNQHTNGNECYEKIKAGASLVQLYTALVYQGPKVVGKIIRELNSLVLTDGYKNISEAVKNARIILKKTKCDAVKIESNNNNFRIIKLYSYQIR